MKKLTFKNTVRTLAALPVVLVEFIVMWVAHRLAHLTAVLLRCRLALLESVSMPDQEPPGRDEQIAELLHLWDTVSDFVVQHDRQTIEKTEGGKRAIKTNPNRHLYSVQKPTRAENLKRLENAFYEMDLAMFNSLCDNTDKIRRKIKAAEP